MNSYKSFLLVLFLCFSNICSAQTFDKYNEMIKKFTQIFINDSVSLIAEDQYYDAEVFRIRKIFASNNFLNLRKTNKGYIISFMVKMSDSTYAFPCVISSNMPFNKEKFKPLKIGDKVRLKFIDYFDHLILNSLEYKYVYDILIGTNTIHYVAGVNCFISNRIFVSPNINGLSYVDSVSLENRNLVFEEDRLGYEQTICKFLNSMYCSSVSFFDIVDTNLVKKSFFSLSSISIRTSLNSKYNTRMYCNKLKYPGYYFDWTELTPPNPNFEQLFRAMTKYFYKVENNEDCIQKFKREDLIIKVLRFWDNELTASVIWKHDDKFNRMFFTVRKTESKFKIVSIAIPEFLHRGFE